jgi:ABC-type multidrug transport system fused ATPase/permease subunit
MKFPHGYDTWVGERGVTLSGGQRQRVAIARAFVRDPRLLILDDATSSVDVETEFLIQRALRSLMVGRTTVVIAHRLYTLRHADLILVLSGGRIAQRGAHDKLLDEPGLYRTVYKQQSRGPEERVAPSVSPVSAARSQA